MKLGLRIALVVVIVLIVVIGVGGVKCSGHARFSVRVRDLLPPVPSTSRRHGCNAESIWRTQSGAFIVTHRMTGASLMTRFFQG